MKRGILQFVIALCLFIPFSGCARRADKSGKEVLARIDRKHTITLGDFNSRILKLPERYQEVINKNKKQFLDELVVDMLLYQEALRNNLDKDKEIKEIFEEAKKKILIARLLKEEVGDKVTVDEREVAEYYDKNTDKFSTPEVLRASHILVKTEEEAKEILAELSRGKDFENLARERSIDPASKVGGDIGYFTRNQLVPEIEEVCFNMKVGEISNIVKTKFGYHIIMLTERREPQIRKLDEVHDQIEQTLSRFRQKMLFNEFVEKLREKSQIVINENLLESMSKEESPDETAKD